jgi:hypothetical protein
MPAMVRKDTWDDLPARRPRIPMLIVVLALPGVGLALLVCAGCGIVGYWYLLAGPSIVGRWELTDAAFIASQATIEFRAGGRGKIQGRMLDVDFEYTVMSDPPRLEWRIKRTGQFTVRPGANLDLKVNNVPLISAPVERFRMILLQDGIILRDENGGRALTLRRVR